jgi:YVTN family beta-propeller protein
MFDRARDVRSARRLRLLTLAAVWAGLCVPAVVYGQSPAKAWLLALSKQDRTLSLVDPVSLRVVAKVPVGPDPHEVTASTDGRTAYVSDYGFGKYHTLSVVDLVGRKALPAIDTLPLGAPHGLAFAGGKVWFTSEVAKAIGRYDPATRTIDWVMGTGQNRIHMLYVSPDLKWLVATNTVSGTVSVIDEQWMHMPGPAGQVNPAGMRLDWNVTNIKVGNGSEGFDVSPDHREVWVANAQDGTLSVIDLAAKKVVATLQSNTKGANRVKFTPDGKRVLVSSGPDLVVLDAGSRQVIRRIPIGHGSAGVLVQPDGKRAFVACSPDGYIAVIDLATLKVVGHLNVGGNPDGMTWVTRQ